MNFGIPAGEAEAAGVSLRTKTLAVAIFVI